MTPCGTSALITGHKEAKVTAPIVVIIMKTTIVFEGLFIFEATSRAILARRAFVSVRNRENDIYPLFCQRKGIPLGRDDESCDMATFFTLAEAI